MIELASPPLPARVTPAEPDAIALAGLLAWTAWNQGETGCDLHVLDDGATLVVATSALAHGFQLGWLDAGSGPGYPFLAYGEALDWFATAWRGVPFSATGVLAHAVEPLAVLLPTHWPAVVGTLARRAALANVPWCHRRWRRRTWIGCASAPPPAVKPSPASTLCKRREGFRFPSWRKPHG